MSPHLQFEAGVRQGQRPRSQTACAQSGNDFTILARKISNYIIHKLNQKIYFFTLGTNRQVPRELPATVMITWSGWLATCPSWAISCMV